MRKTALETKEPQSFEKLELLYTLLKTGEKGALALCICNSPAYRQQLETELAQRLKKDRIALHALELKPGIISIVRAIKEKIDRLSPEPGWRLALSVSGIESTIPETEQKAEGRPQALNSLNLQRDFFIDFPHPIALWLPEWVAKLLPTKAPDFWVVRTSVFECRPPGEEMREYARAAYEFAPFYDSLEDLERRIRIYQKLKAGFGETNKAPAYLWLEMGKLFQAKGEMGTARGYIEKGLNRARQQHDKAGLVALFQQLGVLDQHQGNLDKAEGLYQESLKLAREIGDKDCIASSLHQLAMIEQDRGNLDKAEGLYQESLKLKREMGDKDGISSSLHQMAIIEQQRGNLDKAEGLYQESLKLKREIGDKVGISSNTHQLAMIEEDRGNLDKAQGLHRQALDLDREIGDKYSISKTFHALGMIEQARGNLKKAEGLYQESLEINRDMGDKGGIARSLHQLAMIEGDRGNLEAALKLYVQALGIFSSAGYAEKEIALRSLEALRQKMGAERFEKALKDANVELPPLTSGNKKVLSHKKTSEKKKQ